MHLNGCLSLLKHRFSDCRVELNVSPPPKMNESYREQRFTCMAEPQLVLVLFSEVSRPNRKDRSNLKPEGKGLAAHHPCSHAIGGDRRDITGQGSLSNSNRSPWRPTCLVFRAGCLSRIHRGHMGMGYTDPGAGTSFRPSSQ